MELSRLVFTIENIEGGLDVVRNMKSIKEIGATLEDVPNMTVESFWDQYDEGLAAAAEKEAEKAKAIADMKAEEEKAAKEKDTPEEAVKENAEAGKDDPDKADMEKPAKEAAAGEDTAKEAEARKKASDGSEKTGDGKSKEDGKSDLK